MAGPRAGPTGHKGPPAGAQAGQKDHRKRQSFRVEFEADMRLPYPKPEEEIVEQKLEGGAVQRFEFKVTSQP